LALVIEKISGMPFNEYIEKNILKPANMLQTMFFPAGNQYTIEIKFPFAFPHLYPHRYSDSIVKARDVPYIVEYWSAYNFSGFGDYVSTVDDLLNYDKAYYDGRLLSKDLLGEVFTPVKLTGELNSTGKFWVGLAD
jgi:CubicO group peptidase (beta-lactamase class C family)